LVIRQLVLPTGSSSQRKRKPLFSSKVEILFASKPWRAIGDIQSIIETMTVTMCLCCCCCCCCCCVCHCLQVVTTRPVVLMPQCCCGSRRIMTGLNPLPAALLPATSYGWQHCCHREVRGAGGGGVGGAGGAGSSAAAKGRGTGGMGERWG